MAALRSLEATRSRGLRLVPALAASALLAVGVVAGLSLVGDDKPESVITSEPAIAEPDPMATRDAVIAVATALPTPVSTDDDVGAVEAVLAETPTPTPAPSPTPAPTSTPEANPTAEPEPERAETTATTDTAETAATTDVSTPVPTPTETPDFATPVPTPSATASSADRSAPTPIDSAELAAPANVNGTNLIPTPTATVAATDGMRLGGGDFVGVWELLPNPSADDNIEAEIRILSGGELLAQVGCWTGRAIVETDDDRRLQLVPDSLSVSSLACSNRRGVMPTIFLTLGQLNFGSLPDGQFIWTSDDGPSTHSTGWAPSKDLVVPTLPGERVPATTTPIPVPEVEADETPRVPEVTFDTKGFAGSWELVADDAANAITAEAVLLLSGEGDLALQVGCKVFGARVQINERRVLELVAGSGFVDTNTCADPLASALANGLAIQLADATASIADGQLQWQLPDDSVLTFSPT